MLPLCCSQKVTSLDVTIDGLGLVSGSQDATIRLWNIQSKQCIRCINQKGGCVLGVRVPKVCRSLIIFAKNRADWFGTGSFAATHAERLSAQLRCPSVRALACPDGIHWFDHRKCFATQRPRDGHYCSKFCLSSKFADSFFNSKRMRKCF